MELEHHDKPAENGLLGLGEAEADRRKFLSALGRFSVVTPPAVTLLLSTTLTSQAIAQSGARGNNGFGNGGSDGSPNGKFEDTDR
jgi:hypothetical protein